MRLRGYEGLRVFVVAARTQSFTATAEELHLTKGAISYQVRRLEAELGFELFRRERRGLTLTEAGQALSEVAQAAFREIEQTVERLRHSGGEQITIGTTTYFASRWLSPRLMTFLVAHPRVGLRLQPMIDLIESRGSRVDMTIRWGTGDWNDCWTELLFPCPAFATAGRRTARRIAERGLRAVWPTLVLLHDRDGSEAWRDWHRAAGLPYHPAPNSLVIPDPNVRVQAVIDEQGVALNDRLVAAELAARRLVRVSPVELPDRGYYLAYPQQALAQPAAQAFRAWILSEAAQEAAPPAKDA